MPGVYRDSATGEYRYFSYNDYEDRRRRELDDRRAGRTPFGPPLPPALTPPAISWAPPPQPTTYVPTTPADVSTLLSQLNAQVQPDPGNFLAVLTEATAAVDAAKNAELFNRLVGSLPPQPGVNPGFDRLVQDPNVSTVTIQQALDVLERAAL